MTGFPLELEKWAKVFPVSFKLCQSVRECWATRGKLDKKIVTTKCRNSCFLTNIFVTARIQRMTGGYIFTLCVCPHLEGGTYLPRSGGGGTYLGRYPPPPSHRYSIACACYAAGGMPLAFTQEDFFVGNCFHIEKKWDSLLDIVDKSNILIQFKNLHHQLKV